MITFPFSADFSLGRVGYTSFSQQTLMELLLSDIDGASFICEEMTAVKDVQHWKNVTVNDQGEVTVIDWDDMRLGWYHELRLHSINCGSCKNWMESTERVSAFGGNAAFSRNTPSAE